MKIKPGGVAGGSEGRCQVQDLVNDEMQGVEDKKDSEMTEKPAYRIRIIMLLSSNGKREMGIRKASEVEIPEQGLKVYTMQSY